MGIAGRVAQGFLRSKLTPLVTFASLAVGGIALIATPREEEPQISVPMIDVTAALPGAGPTEVEQLVTRPLEKLMWEVPGVEYVYSTAGDGWTLVTVRFKVGEDQGRSVSAVHAKLAAAADRMPPGALPPMVKPHSIDDVPFLTLTLHSPSAGPEVLRQVAAHLDDEIRTIPDVAQTTIIGGRPRQVRVTLDPVRLAALGLSPAEVMGALQGANTRLPAGEFATGDRSFLVDVGAELRDARDVGTVAVGARQGRPVYLADVATITDGAAEVTDYVSYAAKGGVPEHAVTLAVAKRPGANASTLADQVLERVQAAEARLLPPSVEMAVTRNYGETAREKANELILHLLLATASVTLLIGIFLGWREALVVLVAVPVTLALTMFAYYAFGYTLNRITLFALIFSIGILVDDAIVVVENIYRHLQLGGRPAETAAIEGVDEVGNPTILATFTVIAAILPMAFVSGLMGPYMRPIPVGASAAMLASLAVAFVVTPWLAFKLLARHVHPEGAHGHGAAEESGFGRRYGRLMSALMDRPAVRTRFYVGVGLLLLGSMALVGLKVVQVKMLPFDNKSEFQVVLDLPEGATLETSNAAAQEIAAWLRTVPEVRSTETYAGTAAPFNFNGLVRHYFLRRGANVADVQVDLLPKGDRKRQSHAIALAVRPAVDSIARRYGASAKIAEIPPGPPVLSTLVAEVYAADDSTRLAAAERVRAVLEGTPGVVDVDWTVEAPEGRLELRVDRARVAAAGANAAQVSQTLALALSGATAGRLVDPEAREPVAIVPRLGLADRSSLEALLAVPVSTPLGPVPLGRFVRVDSTTRAPARFRKNLRPVIYVTADVGGVVESPVYAILAMDRALDTVQVRGAEIRRYNATLPDRLDETALKWDGEWQVTIEVFRDLGLAFAVV
ncbi:MAG TPA: efflux RND transporter permease subunit, partial [Gemmatimonadales bacterium]|nr:efflux RND transporter permease subunit [Gemmatimonadales bacterium]